jgi:NAD(P)-dependent dehydrogenase (short-subunit alcohol dehydrogenase family)
MSSPVHVITGGARGFGRAIAAQLLATGARVCLLGRNRSRLDEAVAALGENASAVVCDVADKDSVSSAFAEVEARYGKINSLVANAGVARPGRIEVMAADEIALQLNTNVLGTVLCCQAAIPLLRGAENSRILTMSSASAWHTDEMSHLSIYAASKAAVERFTRDLREELQADGIGVTCLRPGGAESEFALDWDQEVLREAFVAWHDTGPLMDVGMTVDEVAGAVVWALAQPPGVAVDLLEIRPNRLSPKP